MTEEPDALRLTREPGDRGPSLVERIGDRLDRLSFASPLHRMRLKGRFPLKLLAVPDDPIPGDVALGQRLKGGRLFRDGYGQGMLEARLDAPDAPESWRRWVHGWAWLRDLAAAEPLERAEVARAEALAKRWLTRFHDYDETAWAPDLTGQRIRMAIAHAPLVMPGTDHVHRSAVLNGVARWARHLERAAPRMSAGLGKLHAVSGLIGASLILPGGDNRQAAGEALLAETLDLFVDAEGSVASRCPLDLALAGDLLLELDSFYRARAKAPAAALGHALARVRAGLSALAMGDGLPSPWHGGQPNAAQMARLSAGPAAAPPGRQSGFQRLSAGAVRIMFDAGPPPLSRFSACGHASTLAFTMTDGSRRLVVSCGAARGPAGARSFPTELAMGLRSTAGHSALVLADSNSSRLADGGPRRLGGVEEVVVEAHALPEGQLVEARHDGWRRRFGVDHLRRLWLAAAGDDLRGEDHLLPTRGGSHLGQGGKAPAIAIRFHLGPGATATVTEDGRGALIRLAGQRPQQDQAWGFRASFNHGPGRLAIEPSLVVEADGSTREIQQILLTSMPGSDGGADISWSLRRQTRSRN